MPTSHIALLIMWERAIVALNTGLTELKFTCLLAHDLSRCLVWYRVMGKRAFFTFFTLSLHPKFTNRTRSDSKYCLFVFLLSFLSLGRGNDLAFFHCCVVHCPMRRPIIGWLLLALGFLFFSLTLYTTTVSKLLPRSGIWVLDAIKDDHYYCLLVPLTLVITSLFVTCNWMAFKVFRYNWCAIFM